MNILIYGEQHESVAELVRSSGAMQYRQLHFFQPNTYDEYLKSLQSDHPELIIISIPGALGMEAAIAARDIHRQTPLIWFSDDEAFGAQSYRIECAYFTAKPVDEGIVEEAILRCTC